MRSNRTPPDEIASMKAPRSASRPRMTSTIVKSSPRICSSALRRRPRERRRRHRPPPSVDAPCSVSPPSLYPNPCCLPFPSMVDGDEPGAAKRWTTGSPPAGAPRPRGLAPRPPRKAASAAPRCPCLNRVGRRTPGRCRPGRGSSRPSRSAHPGSRRARCPAGRGDASTSRAPPGPRSRTRRDRGRPGTR
jgi:hypothetical protein